MASGRNFKNSYMVTIEGRTVGGWQAKLFHDLLHSLAKAIGINSQQVNINVKTLETNGEFNADSGKTNLIERKRRNVSSES